MRRGSQTTTSFGKPCDGTTKAHADAMKIVEYLADHDGTIEIPQDELAHKLDMLKHERRGMYIVDKSRFSRARNHLMDCVDGEGKPCCGYRIHYRRAGQLSTFSLSDPKGDMGAHREAALGSVLGWMSRERQHHTENQRQIAVFETLADDVLKNGDKEGYKILQRAVIDLDRDGTVIPETMAQLQNWATAFSA